MSFLARCALLVLWLSARAIKKMEERKTEAMLMAVALKFASPSVIEGLRQ